MKGGGKKAGLSERINTGRIGFGHQEGGGGLQGSMKKIEKRGFLRKGGISLH